MFSQDEHVLNQLFFNRGIRVFGTVKDPLFVLAHVAKQIGDQNYRRTAKTLTKGKHVVKKPCEGIHPDPILLTERGIYLYLLRSGRDEAEPFVDWVMDVLCEMRQKVVDEERLRSKIIEDKLAIITESLEAATSVIACTDVGTYRMMPDHTYDKMYDHAVNKWCARQYHYRKLLFNRESIPVEITKALHKMALKYFTHDECEHYYDDIFPVLCKWFEVPCGAEICARMKHISRIIDELVEDTELLY